MMTIFNQENDEQANADSDEVATAPSLWRPIARAVGGFDVDPASGAEHTPIADTTYTRADDGLLQTWDGKVWLNPPFSAKTQWIRKAIAEHEKGNAELVVLLCPVDTSTEWFQRWFTQAKMICYLNGRGHYEARGSPNFASMIGVWGIYAYPELKKVLETKGTLQVPVRSTGQLTFDEVQHE